MEDVIIERVDTDDSVVLSQEKPKRTRQPRQPRKPKAAAVPTVAKLTREVEGLLRSLNIAGGFIVGSLAPQYADDVLTDDEIRQLAGALAVEAIAHPEMLAWFSRLQSVSPHIALLQVVGGIVLARVAKHVMTRTMDDSLMRLLGMDDEAAGAGAAAV